MKIEEFMNDYKEYKNKIPVSNDISFYYDIKTYNIEEEKQELIESISKYIKFYDYNAEVNYFLGNDYTFIQAETKDNKKAIVKFNLISDYILSSNEFISKETTPISNEEYYERISKFKRIGSQNIRMLNTGLGTIYFSEDNHVFVTKDFVERVIDMDIMEMGKRLAKTTIDLKLHDKTYKYNHEHAINRLLELKYKKGLIEKYKYKNNKIVLKKKKK